MSAVQSDKFNRAFTNLARVWEPAGFLLVLALGICLRFVNLRAFPGWYTDEGDFIVFARSLAQGSWQYYGITGPMLIQRPPLFLYLLAGAFKLFGADILVLRALTAGLGCLLIGLIYFLIRQVYGPKLAFLSAGTFALFPWFISYNRQGYSYNLLILFVVLFLWTIWRYYQTRRWTWALASSILAGLAVSTDYLGLAVVIVLLAVLVITNWRWALIGGLISASVLFLIVLPVYLAEPHYFFSDLTMSTSRAIQFNWTDQIAAVSFAGAYFIQQEGWIALGLASLLWLPGGSFKKLSLFYVMVVMLGVLRVLVPTGAGGHYLIPVFPLVAIGLAVLFDRLVSGLGSLFQTGIAKLIRWLHLSGSFLRDQNLLNLMNVSANLIAVMLLITVSLPWVLGGDTSLFITGTDLSFTDTANTDLTSEQDAQKTIDFLSSHLADTDLVFASAQLAWDIPSQRVLTYPSLHSCEGFHAPGQKPFPVDRFVFPCRLEDARYAVIDPFGLAWAQRDVNGIDNSVQNMMESWPLVFQTGDIQVYANPEKNGG